jgi:Glyoxalase-like domain
MLAPAVPLSCLPAVRSCHHDVRPGSGSSAGPTRSGTVPSPPEGFATWDDFDRALPAEQQGSAFACVDPSGVGPRLFFQRVPEGKVVKNRMHLDVRVGTGRPRTWHLRESTGAVRPHEVQRRCEASWSARRHIM